MAHIDAETKDLSVALIVLVCVLVLIGALFLITLRYYISKGQGYSVNTVDKGIHRREPRSGNGESTNTFVNEAYSMEKMKK